MKEEEIADVNKLKEEVKDALENSKDYNSAEELFDDVLDMKHYCSNCESYFEGIGDDTCPECEEKFEEQRWWEGGFNKLEVTYNNGVTEPLLLIDKQEKVIKHFIKQVEDNAREEERKRIIRLIKEKGLHLGYANPILKLIEK